VIPGPKADGCNFPLAHSLPKPFPRSSWEDLEEHLRNVAELAERFDGRLAELEREIDIEHYALKARTVAGELAWISVDDCVEYIPHRLCHAERVSDVGRASVLA
jgi:hypothetical protein